MGICMKKQNRTKICALILIIAVAFTAMIMMIVLPGFNHSDKLVNTVADKLHLGLDETEATANPEDNYVHVEMVYAKPKSVALKKMKKDTKVYHVSWTGITLYVNKKADDYVAANQVIAQNKSKINRIMRKTAASYTREDAGADKIANDALQQIQQKFDTQTISKIVIKNYKIE